MQRNIQFLLLLAVVSMVFATTYEPNGCREGKLFSIGCIVCECVKGEPQCFQQKEKSCPPKGSQEDFYIYPKIEDPPRAKDLRKKYGDSNLESTN